MAPSAQRICSMPSCAKISARMATPPGNTARRSSVTPSSAIAATLPADISAPMIASMPSAVMRSGLRVQRLLHLEYRAHGAGAAGHLLPAALEIGFLHRLQFLLRGQARAGEALSGQLAVAEVARAHPHAAQLQAFQFQRFDAAPDDHLGAATADVHDQAVVRGVGQGLCDTGIDQARFLASGDDFDAVAQGFAGLVEEGLAIARLAQGTGAHHAHAAGVHVLESLAEATQAGQRARGDILVEPALLVHAFGQAHRSRAGDQGR